MSGFSAEWLTLRERYDVGRRAASIQAPPDQNHSAVESIETPEQATFVWR